MLESWNNGIMGSGRMEYWAMRPFSLELDVKNGSLLGQSLIKTSIPTFHYSMGEDKTSGPLEPISSQ
jgi:hypothetical protein